MVRPFAIMTDHVVSSERLDLVPMTADFMAAIVALDAPRASEIGGFSVPAEWPREVVPQGWLQVWVARLRADPGLLPWLSRAMVLRSNRTMVGNIGFHGYPGEGDLRSFSPGAGQFGYGVLEPYRRQGFATEAAQALMRWAHDEHGIGRFVISIAQDNVPSQGVARRLGFVPIGSHVHSVRGSEDIWELRMEETGAPPAAG